MSWTYTGTLATSLDVVRFLIGDTDTTDQQLSDEELNGLLALTGADNTTAAAIRACRALSAKYARQADKWVGDLKILASQKARRYAELAKDLEAQGAGFGGRRTHQTPFAGGTSVAQKETIEADTDVPPYPIKIGVHDHE